MGRLRFSPQMRAYLAACIAALALASLPGAPARAEDKPPAREAEPATLQDSILAEIPEEPVNPMQAISVMLGGGRPQAMSGLLSQSLLSMDSNAVIGAAHPQSSELELRMEQLQLAQQRERINALSTALALDDNFSAARFGNFPEPLPQVTVAPASSQATPAKASSGKPAATKPAQPGNTKQHPVASGSTGPPSFRVAETTGDPHDPEFRRQTIEELNTLLASLPDPAEAGLEGLPGQDGNVETTDMAEASNEVEPYGAIGMSDSGSGFHGLLDLSHDELDQAETDRHREPGSAVSSFGVKMAIFTVGILLLASFLKGKGNPLARLSRRSMKVLETVNLGPGRQIMVVETSGAKLVLGVTGGGINLLDRIPDQASGEAYRDNMEDIINRESKADEDSWKQRPALDLLDTATLRGNSGSTGDGRSISVAQLRQARASAVPQPASQVPDRHAELLSRVRTQLERVRG
ncbi:flagellar biosynthetic protein FliO [bacterium]|nr:flagellar biosynthetic protein FliO [bacterium]